MRKSLILILLLLLGIAVIINTGAKGCSEVINPTEEDTGSSVAPAAPSNLITTTVSSSQIIITWQDNSSERGFSVERKTGSGAYAEIASLARDTATYTDSGLSANTTYYYRVRAFNYTDWGAYSSELSVTTPDTGPDAPSNLSTTTVSDSKVNLSWTDNSLYEQGFKVERKTGVAGVYSQIAAVGRNVTTYSDTTVSPSTNYYYRVRGYYVAVDGSYSNEVSATTLEAGPEAPTNLITTTASASNISLSWTDNSLYEQGFKLERKIGLAGTYSQISILDRDTTTYSDTTVSPATNYYYRVRGYYIAVDGSYSNEVSVTTPDAGWDMPFVITVTAISPTRITVAWSDNFNGESGFIVERKTGSTGSYAGIISLAANITLYNDDTVTQSTTYYYRVSSSYSSAIGPISTEGWARTSGISADYWTALPTASAPAGRIAHNAVWADGYGMLVYGGDYLRNGGIYTATGWAAMNAGVNRPSARTGHSAVWTGTEMLVWGGELASRWDAEWTWDEASSTWVLSAYGWSAYDGARYDPATDSWATIASINPYINSALDRVNHTAIWTGDRMIVWGGENLRQPITSNTINRIRTNTGGIYDPSTNTWGSFPRLSTGDGAPSARKYHTAVWTGGQMIVWGGDTGSPSNSGGGYSPTTDFWILEPLATANAPSARSFHTAVWTGTGSESWRNKMIVWGGTNNEAYYNDGGIYDPVANTWSSMASTNAPSKRVYHSAVWTGSKMIVWGGGAGVLEGAYSTGGIYNPAKNSWVSTPSGDAPSPRTMHTAVWDSITKSMLIWGGWDGQTTFNTGASYLFSTVDTGEEALQGADPGAIGDITFNLMWTYSGSSQSEGPDIDLWVTCPNAHTLSTSRNDFSLGPEPESGRIDYDDLGGYGDGDGAGPERAYWPTGQSPAGTYTYGIRYYQGDGTANYTVRVYKSGILVDTKTGSFSAPASAITLGTITNP